MMSFSSKEFIGFELFPVTPRYNERTCWKAEFVVSMCAHCLMRNTLLTVVCRSSKDRAAVENSRAASEQARRVASSSLTCSRMMEIISCGRIRQRGGVLWELQENELDILGGKSQAYPGATATWFLAFLFFGTAFPMAVAGS